MGVIIQNGQLGNNSTENFIKSGTSKVSRWKWIFNQHHRNLQPVPVIIVALRNDGTVWTWGSNTYGQLGNGSSVNSMLPVQVKSADGNSFLADIVQISAGYVHSMALKKDGTVLAWGRNDGGQLGK